MSLACHCRPTHPSIIQNNFEKTGKRKETQFSRSRSGWQSTSSEGVNSREKAEEEDRVEIVKELLGVNGHEIRRNRKPCAIRRRNFHRTIVTCGRSRVTRSESYSATTVQSLSLVFFGLFLGGFFLALTVFVLDIFIVYTHSLIDLGTKGRLVRGSKIVSMRTIVRLSVGIRTG